MMEGEYEVTSARPSTNTGSADVVIHCLPQPPHVANAANMAQNTATTFSGTKDILMTGFGGRVGDWSQM